LLVTVIVGLMATIPFNAAGQGGAAAAREAARTAAGYPPGCSTLVSERKTETGCYTTAETSLGTLPSGALFWHLYTYPSRAAAEAARGPKATTVESFGKHWVFTIALENWQPPTGEKVAVIGPLVIATDKEYTAHYMESVFPPGTQPVGGPGHRHPGPEAWYVLSGTQCLETPNGVIKASAGGAAMVPEGWPMAVSDYGTETRRAVNLILHPSSEPLSMAIDDPRSPGAPHSHWKPLGLCAK
jgi:quercetin dioxygenase-like cupin family protein